MSLEFTPNWSDNDTPGQPLPGEVHVWSLPLTISPPQQNALWEILSDDERTRAGRFLFDDHRRRFVACRGRVRKILASYLNERPESLAFRYSGLGKPALDRASDQTMLSFNVTHSSELALLAIGADGELGPARRTETACEKHAWLG